MSSASCTVRKQIINLKKELATVKSPLEQSFSEGVSGLTVITALAV